VPDDLIWTIVDASTRAPNGGNRQPWGFIILTDDAQRAEIGRLVREELAARGVGLGGVLTMVQRRFEPQLRGLLGIPDEVQLVCMIPLGFPDAKFGPTARRPVQEVAHWGAWGATRQRPAPPAR
jgi:nitroreductase